MTISMTIATYFSHLSSSGRSIADVRQKFRFFCSVATLLSRLVETPSFGAHTVSLTATDASSDVQRSQDAPLPSVPTRDDQRSPVGVSVAIRQWLIGRLGDVRFALVDRTRT